MSSRQILPQELELKQNILVLASYRTGSTALCDVLFQETNYNNVDEIFHRTHLDNAYEKHQYSNSIIKVMPDQTDTSYWNLVTSNSTIVGITRKSIVDQIASFYISHVTSIWHNKLGNNSPGEIIIDKFSIEDQIRYIKSMNEIYNNRFKPLLDIEFTYEDISPHLTYSRYKKNNKPTNYELLVETITNLMTEI